MKRWEIIDILREILRVCGDKIKVEMVWLKGETKHAGIDDDKFQIVMSAIFDEAAIACIKPITEKYGLKMKHERGFWVFIKEANGSERIIQSASSV
jgi:hypothetical protein